MTLLLPKLWQSCILLSQFKRNVNSLFHPSQHAHECRAQLCRRNPMVQRLVLTLVLFFALAGCGNQAPRNQEIVKSQPDLTQASSIQSTEPCREMFYNLARIHAGACPHVDHQIEYQKDDSSVTTRNENEDRYPVIICRCKQPSGDEVTTSSRPLPSSPLPPIPPTPQNYGAGGPEL